MAVRLAAVALPLDLVALLELVGHGLSLLLVPGVNGPPRLRLRAHKQKTLSYTRTFLVCCCVP
jgi:hypothetical protein